MPRQGFEQTTIDQIAAEAGVSERTFFRYFATKASVLFTEFEDEVEHIRAALARTPGDVPMIDAIRHAVVSANHYRAADVPELRIRMNLFHAALTALGCGFAPEAIRTVRPAITSASTPFLAICPT